MIHVFVHQTGLLRLWLFSEPPLPARRSLGVSACLPCISEKSNINFFAPLEILSEGEKKMPQACLLSHGTMEPQSVHTGAVDTSGDYLQNFSE